MVIDNHIILPQLTFFQAAKSGSVDLGGSEIPFLPGSGGGGGGAPKNPSLGIYGHYVPTAATANITYSPQAGAAALGGLTTVESAGVKYAGEENFCPNRLKHPFFY